MKDMHGCWCSCDEQVPGDAHNSHAQSRLFVLDLERALALLGVIRSELSPPRGEAALFAQLSS